MMSTTGLEPSSLAELECLRAMASLAPDLLWRTDVAGRAEWVNQRWIDYTGQPQAAALGLGWIEALDPAEGETLRQGFAQGAPGGATYTREHRLRGADGRYRWFLIRAAPVRFGADPVRYLAAASDIDTYRRADERNRQLLAELQHRVRNIIAAIRAISAGTLARSDSLEEFGAHFTDRLDVLARTQSAVSRTGANGLDLEGLVRDEFAAHGVRDEAQASVAGPQILLRGRAVEIFAMVLHELTTNAVKYGALVRPGGRIAVAWRATGSGELGTLRLEWRETGVQLAPDPKADGFGRDLIERRLPYELDATTALTFGEDGVRCTIDVPLGPRIVALEPISGGVDPS